MFLVNQSGFYVYQELVEFRRHDEDAEIMLRSTRNIMLLGI